MDELSITEHGPCNFIVEGITEHCRCISNGLCIPTCKMHKMINY